MRSLVLAGMRPRLPVLFLVLFFFHMVAVLSLPPHLRAASRSSGGQEAKKPAFLPLTPFPEQPGAVPPALPSAPRTEMNIPGDAAATNAEDAITTDSAGATPPPALPAHGSGMVDAPLKGVIRVELRPARPWLLSAPFPVTVLAVAVQDGELVTEGQTVARFDARSMERELEESRSSLTSALERVQKSQSSPQRERVEAQGLLARNADAVQKAEERLALTTLVAPAAGRVIGVRAFAGQRLKRGDPVVEVAEHGDLEIVASAPSVWVSRLAPGHIIWVYIEETAKSYEAEFARFGGKVDTATRTVQVYAKFLTTPEELLPGMSGRADFFPIRSK